MTRILNDKSVRELISVSRDIGKLSAISELLVKKDFPQDALVPVAREINQYVFTLRETLHNFVEGLDLSLVDDDSVDYDEKVIGDALQADSFNAEDDDVIVIDDDDTIEEVADDVGLATENDIDLYGVDSEVEAESEEVATRDIINEEAIAEDVVSKIDDVDSSESEVSDLNVEDELDFDALEKSIDIPDVNILDEQESKPESEKAKRFAIDESLLQAELDGVGD